MTQQPYLSIARLERRLSTGNTEELLFGEGVNVLVGRPNTGKTKWLQTLDYLLGDLGDNPFQGAEETGLAEKYEAAAADVVIGGELVRVERRWREPGAKTKVFVDGTGLSAKDFQHWLLEKLSIPLLHFPKGNPMSGQTWPELSFRMLLRHILRQQRFWGGIADQQPDGEQHACLLQFLGLAERIFTEDYGRLVDLKRDAERLKARREQYTQTLEELARDVLAGPSLSVGVSTATVQAADTHLAQEVELLRGHRVALLTEAQNRALPPDLRRRTAVLGEMRVAALAKLEELQRKAQSATERLHDLRRYRTELADELERMARAEDAGATLADLKVTHCPACDQSVSQVSTDSDHCFLCHQELPEKPILEELGVIRLRFEHERLAGEFKEADELVDVMERETGRLGKEAVSAEEELRGVENELSPARLAVSALVQEDVSAIDMALGAASERQRQLGRIAAALGLGDELTKRVGDLERQIEPLDEKVNEAIRSTDFDAAAAHLEDGMNAYLNAINQLRPGIWRHNAVAVDISRSSFNMRVGRRNWHQALGGTDQLYFLMAYHYGLLRLSAKAGCHYPGLSIIDVPGEFAGEAVEDTENFIVQPFIDLLRHDAYRGAQLIITGASFTNLDGAHRQHLTHVHVS